MTDLGGYEAVRNPSRLAPCGVVSTYAGVVCQKAEGHRGPHHADILGTDFTWTIARSDGREPND